MKKERLDEFCGWVYTIGSLTVLAAPIIWAYQIYHWLRWGAWQSISVADGLAWAGAGTPRFAWAGVQTLSDLVMAVPLSIAAIFVPIMAAWGVSELADSLTKPKAPDAGL